MMEISSNPDRTHRNVSEQFSVCYNFVIVRYVPHNMWIRPKARRTKCSPHQLYGWFLHTTLPQNSLHISIHNKIFSKTDYIRISAFQIALPEIPLSTTLALGMTFDVALYNSNLHLHPLMPVRNQL